MKPILIAGPTASGKSALALQLADQHAGVVVNADSMQVYRELAILTARPPPEDLARVPHCLYGHVPAAKAYSVARWLSDVSHAMKIIAQAGRRAIVVGGTGLYFKALTEGLSPIPEIPREIRERWRAIAAAEGAACLYRELLARDPAMAGRLKPADTQRLTRALEVVEATGRSLADWQSVPGTPLLPIDRAVPIMIDPPRAELLDRCDRRFDLMMETGVAVEVRALLGLGLDRTLPVFGALGVGALTDWIEGRVDRETAVAAAKMQTRQYVKRQRTWNNRHMSAWNVVKSHEYYEIEPSIDHLIDC